MCVCSRIQGCVTWQRTGWMRYCSLLPLLPSKVTVNTHSSGWKCYDFIHLFLQGGLEVFSRRNLVTGRTLVCWERMGRKCIDPQTCSWASPSFRNSEEALTEFWIFQLNAFFFRKHEYLPLSTRSSQTQERSPCCSRWIPWSYSGKWTILPTHLEEGHVFVSTRVAVLQLVTHKKLKKRFGK